MATLSHLITNTSSLHPSRSGKTRLPYTVEVEIDFAVALAQKGTALAASDIIEAIRLPAGTVVHAAGIEQVEAANSQALTLDLGITGGDVDIFVDGFDAVGGAAGAYAAQPSAGARPLVIGTADTLDVLFATLTDNTGTQPLTSGKVRVWAVVTDVSGMNAPGIATRD